MKPEIEKKLDLMARSCAIDDIIRKGFGKHMNKLDNRGKDVWRAILMLAMSPEFETKDILTIASNFHYRFVRGLSVDKIAPSNAPGSKRVGETKETP